MTVGPEPPGEELRGIKQTVFRLPHTVSAQTIFPFGYQLLQMP